MLYKQIMVAVDGSPISILALKEAIQLAENQEGKLRIIHVLEPFIHEDLDYHEQMAFYKKNGEHILNSMKEIARQSKVTFETLLVVAKERVAEKIVKEAKKWPADLIVIGTHGRHGLSHMLMGSVAEGVIRLATTPVLLIRG